VIDLSVVVSPTMQVYPGDPQPRFVSATRIETHGYNVLSLSLGSHTGTHVDSPYHFLSDGERLEELDPRLFLGTGVIVDVHNHGPRAPITWPDLEPYADRLGPGVILALRTDWSDRHLGTELYFQHPFLEAEACSKILDLGVRTIAIDALNPDVTMFDSGAAADFPIHRLIQTAGGVIAENLTNLGAVDFEAPLLCLLPIRLGGDADGAPCRAAALELTDR